MSNCEEQLFYRALLLSPDQREPFLDDECGNNRQLRQRLALLLEANDRPQTLLDRPVANGILAALPSEDAVETTIGSYVLGEKIGEGTFGVVYVAEQTRPLRRDVALKIVKPGMDSTEILARFEAERQTLALMQHPNIALIFDGGTTPAGRPYFVMELVRGVPITEYCDQHRLSVPERLQLFLAVCGAVEHAHQKGVIHRDLKPSNILVTLRDGMAVPKVIDFGVAKVMAANELDVTISTHCAQLIGTPAYMSPEQAELSNVDVDTRSDVYSLGVLLNELLTGETPHRSDEMRTLRFDELRRVIQEVEPAPPSRALRLLDRKQADSIARPRRTNAHQLQRTCRGELDWIVLKALSKQRNERYQSAGALAADLRRYLSGDAVEAGPPTTVYLLSKFAQRHRRVLGTALAIVVILLAATGISLWQSVRATLAEQNAEELRLTAESRADQARQLLYASDIRLAAGASSRNDITRMHELLAYHIPGPGEPDRRGFEWHYLWKHDAVSSEVIATFDHALYFLALSPDGKWLACCGGADDVALFDAQTFELRRTISSRQGEVNGLAFSRNSRWLATAGDDGCVVLWDLQTGKEIRRIKAHAKLAFQAGFSPDDTILVTCGNEPTIRLWDPLTGASIGTLRHHEDREDRVECLAVSPDGVLAAGSRDHTATLWQLDDRKRVLTDDPVLATGIVGSVAFGGNGDLLVTGTGRGLLSFIDVDPAPVVRMRQSLQDGISAVAVSENATSVLVGDNSGLIQQLSASLHAGSSESDGDAPSISWRWQAHDGSVSSLAYLPGDRGVVSAGSDGRLVRWTRPAGGRMIRLQKLASDLAFVSPTQLIATEKTLRLFDASIRALLHESAPLESDYRILAVAPQVGTLFAATMNRVVSADADDVRTPSLFYESPPGYETRQIAVNRTGTCLALFLYDTNRRQHRVELIDTASKRVSVTRRCDSINTMTFSPDGTTLAFSQNNDICLMNVADGSLEGRLVGHGDSMQALAFSPDGCNLASGSDDRTIRVWDVNEQRQLWMTVAHANSVRSLDFSPDGQTVVSGGDDPYLRLWNWHAGRMLCELPTEAGRLRRVRFSPDGNRLAALTASHHLLILDGTPVEP